MKRFFIILGLLAAVAIGVESFGRGIGGGGGHAGGGGGAHVGGGGGAHVGGGGGAHVGGGGGGGRSFSGGGTPSFGGGGGARPSFSGGSRPSFVPQSRPASSIAGGGNFNRPNIGTGSRPTFADNRPSSFPSNFNSGARPQVVNRPTFSGDNRPDFGIGNRPNIGQNTRPDWASGGNKPGGGGDRPDWAGGGNRPGWNGGGVPPDNGGGGNRPGWNGGGDRPDWAGGGGNRPGWNGGGNNRPDWNGGNNRPDWNGGNRPINNGNIHIGNNDININHNNWINNNHNWNNNINRWANNGNWNHPWYNHYANWHGDWHHGYWGYWGRGYYPWAWFGAGSALGWFASPGTTYVYSNPYYVVPAETDAGYYPDYSQPIPPPTDQEPQQLADASGAVMPPGDASDQTTNFADAGANDPNAQQAEGILDDARASFKQGDYQAALDKADQAIKLLPSDATLHEFRALCLFALKRYQEAAAGVYAVLAAGPGWDWDTMKALYPDANTYTTQLRALEDYKKANPDKPDASFLLAYHYLVLGYPDQAVSELQQVVKLQPNDKLAAALLKALQERNNPQQQAAPTPTAS